jgi:hypothetical protein
MNNSDKRRFLTIIIIIVPIVTWLGSGYMAWNWVNPESFWGFLLFLVSWGVFGYIAQTIGREIIFAIASMMQ